MFPSLFHHITILLLWQRKLIVSFQTASSPPAGCLFPIIILDTGSLKYYVRKIFFHRRDRTTIQIKREKIKSW